MSFHFDQHSSNLFVKEQNKDSNTEYFLASSNLNLGIFTWVTTLPHCSYKDFAKVTCDLSAELANSRT